MHQEPHPNLLRLGSFMALYGLIVSCAGPFWSNYLMRTLPEGRWDYRMLFLSACATALGGVFLRWVCLRRQPAAFPVLLPGD
ncbi:MAG TPA: hypothetical protein VHM90_19015 [Phycisphaerae bacterium]|jgi:hypothetical protein|nr:hypothetical protein [Phycisphaerae bacterium]